MISLFETGKLNKLQTQILDLKDQLEKIAELEK
jgi:hypothetical protein